MKRLLELALDRIEVVRLSILLHGLDGRYWALSDRACGENRWSEVGTEMMAATAMITRAKCALFAATRAVGWGGR